MHRAMEFTETCKIIINDNFIIKCKTNIEIYNYKCPTMLSNLLNNFKTNKDYFLNIWIYVI